MQIIRTRGDTVPDRFTVTNAKTREIVNLTSCTFKLTVSSVENPTDTTTQLFQLDGVVEFPGSGVVEFFPALEHVDRVGYFYFDVQMTDSYGQVFTLVKDAYIFQQDITK